MQQVLADYLQQLGALHAGAEAAIAGLTSEALDWVSGPGLNSLAVLVTHLAGAERYWIGDMVGRDSSARVREAEFQVHGRSVEELNQLLRRTLAHSQSVLMGLTAEELNAGRVSARDGKTFSVAWCLVHALEHDALHLGHLQITRQLWDQMDT